MEAEVSDTGKVTYVMRFKAMRARRFWRTALTWVLFCVPVVTVAGCSAAGKTDDELVILSPHWEGIQQEFERGFADYWKAKTGRSVDITWLDQGGTSQILRFISSEYKNSPEGIGIDLMFGGGVDPYLKLVKDGVTHPFTLPDSVLTRIPAHFAGMPMYDSTGRWYGATMSGFGIVFNKAVARRLGRFAPHTWKEMGDPSWRGWIGAGDPRLSGSIHMAYELMLQAYGWEEGWKTITAIAANTRSFARGAAEIPLSVARGDAVAGMCIDFYAWSEVTHVGSSELSFVYPVNLTAVNPDAICILRGAPHLNLAKEFVTFVMSEPGQRLWSFKKGAPGGPLKNQLNRFTVMPDLYERYPEHIAVEENPFSWRVTFQYDSGLGSRRWSVVNDLIGAQLIDSHRELEQAWEALRQRGMPEEGLSLLASQPVSPEQALVLAEQWKDPAVRNAYLSQWTAFARDKYRAVIRGEYGSNRQDTH